MENEKLERLGLCLGRLYGKNIADPKGYMSFEDRITATLLPGFEYERFIDSLGQYRNGFSESFSSFSKAIRQDILDGLFPYIESAEEIVADTEESTHLRDPFRLAELDDSSGQNTERSDTVTFGVRKRGTQDKTGDQVLVGTSCSDRSCLLVLYLWRETTSPQILEQR